MRGRLALGGIGVALALAGCGSSSDSAYYPVQGNQSLVVIPDNQTQQNALAQSGDSPAGSASTVESSWTKACDVSGLSVWYQPGGQTGDSQSAQADAQMACQYPGLIP